MGKNKNGSKNRLENECREIRRWAKMDEKEVYRHLDSSEYGFDTMVEQAGRNLLKVKGAKYPNFTENLFANPSVSKYVYNLAYSGRKIFKKLQKDEFDLSEEDLVEDKDYVFYTGLRNIVAHAYKKISAQREGSAPPEVMVDKRLKQEMLLDTFQYLDKERIKIAERFKLSEDDKESTRYATVSMAIYGYLGIYGAQELSRLINISPVPDKRKFRLFKKLVGKNWKVVMGAMFTSNSSKNTFIEFMYNKFNDFNKKTRKKILRGYAKSYKEKNTRHYMLESDQFFSKNKKIIKKLINEDIGFHKALVSMAEKKGKK